MSEPTDDQIIASPQAQLLRYSLVGMTAAARLKLNGISAPSYMRTALENVFAALDQWTADEARVKSHAA